jgi:hypothetical protein
MRPGEYKMVGVPAGQLQNSIWERTLPQPSTVAFSMLEFLLGAAKDLAAVKDVISGDAPSTAPVGTTLALQNQALQVFSSIYKRIYRGFKREFQLIYKTLKRFPNDTIRKEYNELTGGDFDEDFSGDGTDIQPVADPTVVTNMQKVARFQAILQFAESQVGIAAGMTQTGPAQQLAQDFLDLMDQPAPERYVAAVPPNPMAVAEVQEKQASAQRQQADAAAKAASVHLQAAKANQHQAETVAVMGNVGEQTHQMHEQARRQRLGLPEPNGSGEQQEPANG